ncbi:MAG: DUF2236 domain-containing protein [Bacteroidia bacterium]|jgi:hypothetical protein|nr:DUF2236 domain-containing protein [Bacteroidia bacterium]
MQPALLQQLDNFRLVGDTPADQAIQAIVALGDYKSIINEIMTLQKNNDAIPAHWPEKVQSFFVDQQQLPPFANPLLIKRASGFYARFEAQIQWCLFTLSLPYCYAAAKDAEVLTYTKRLQQDTEKRLKETGKFVQDVMQPNAFTPDGSGIISILKVRLIHALVRYHAQHYKLWKHSPEVPINQESMAGTQLAFSYIILRGLRKLYLTVSDNDAIAYLHTWSVVGYLLGVELPLLPTTLKQASQLDQAIAERHFKASPTGQALASALLATANSLMSPQQINEQLLPIMQHLLGNEIYAILQLPEVKPSPTAVLQRVAFGLFSDNILQATDMQQQLRELNNHQVTFSEISPQ